MRYRPLGSTGIEVSEICLGGRQIGGEWGEDFDFERARNSVNHAVELGVNFIDTADVYSDGKSEKAISDAIRSRSERVTIATKCGRRLSPHTSEKYTCGAIRGFVEDSIANMECDSLDLIQLHCPPTEVYYKPVVFETLEELKREGKVRHYGVSVEKVEEGLKAIEYPGVETVQIIFNMFRHRPAELFFDQAKRRNIGVIVREPLASGLLSGKLSKSSGFDCGYHRSLNRGVSAFDRGDTYAGVDYETAVEAVAELQSELPTNGATMAQLALRWILMFDAVSCIVPGAARPEQAVENAKAADLPPLSGREMEAVRRVYDEKIRYPVHYLW